MEDNTEQPKIHYKEIQYGFEYGSATITRLASDAVKGWVVFSLETPKSKKHGNIQIYVTKTGKTKIYVNNALVKTVG